MCRYEPSLLILSFNVHHIRIISNGIKSITHQETTWVLAFMKEIIQHFSGQEFLGQLIRTWALLLAQFSPWSRVQYILAPFHPYV